MKKTIVQTVMAMVVLCLITACSKGGEKNENEETSSDMHTYHVEIAGGETYKGSVPSYAPGVVEAYNPVSFVEYSEEISSKVLAGILQDVPGDFQFGIGLAMDDSNQPTIPESGVGITFGKRTEENKYGPAGPVNMTLKNYKEHDYSFAGEEGTVASFTLSFSGKFKLGADGEEVDVTGDIVVVAP